MSLCRVLGDPAWTADPTLATATGRAGATDDGSTYFWASGAASRSADEIVARLWGAGVPVGQVVQPHRQPELPQLASRGFFEDVLHPVGGPLATAPSR